jgi:hypothetical protein
VLHGGLANEEATARAINAEPWKLLPGMIKAQCPQCRYFFAASVATTTLLPGLCRRRDKTGGVTRQSKPPGSGVIHPGPETRSRLGVMPAGPLCLSSCWQGVNRRPNHDRPHLPFKCALVVSTITLFDGVAVADFDGLPASASRWL